MQVSVCASEPEEVTTLFPDEGSMRVCEQLEFNLGGVSLCRSTQRCLTWIFLTKPPRTWSCQKFNYKILYIL